MVVVRRNLTVEKKVKDLLMYKKRLPPKKYSVTRLTCCPRKTYCKMLGIEEVPPEGRELIFARGRAHHGILEVFKPNEVVINKDKIRGDIDMIGNRVTEIYTTNISSKRVKTDEDVSEIFTLKTRQLKAYLYMVGELEGDLLVFFLFGDYTRLRIMPNGKTRYTGIIPELKDWTLIYEEKELHSNWEELLTKRSVIDECLGYNISKAIFSFIPKLRELWIKWHTGELSKAELYDLIAIRQVVIAQLKLPDWVGEEFECKNCGYAYVCPEWNKEVARV